MAINPEIKALKGRIKELAEKLKNAEGWQGEAARYQYMITAAELLMADPDTEILLMAGESSTFLERVRDMSKLAHSIKFCTTCQGVGVIDFERGAVTKPCPVCKGKGMVLVTGN